MTTIETLQNANDQLESDLADLLALSESTVIRAQHMLEDAGARIIALKKEVRALYRILGTTAPETKPAPFPTNQAYYMAEMTRLMTICTGGGK